MLLRVAFSWLAACVMTAYAQRGPETTLTQLPQDHEYQRVLRAHMATLTEEDFNHGVTEKMRVDSPTSADPEYLYRQYILTMMHQPLIGSKRGAPAITSGAVHVSPPSWLRATATRRNRSPGPCAVHVARSSPAPI